MEVDDPLNILEQQLEQYIREGDERSLFLLLHDITIRFENDRRYRNDTRYIRIWLQYASYFRNPGWIYDHMFEHGIGEYVGAFYEHAADYYVFYRHCLSDAEEIIKLGIRKKAEPLSCLYQVLHLIQQQEQQPKELNDIKLLTLLKDRPKGVSNTTGNTTAIPSSPVQQKQVKKKDHDIKSKRKEINNMKECEILKQHQMRMTTVQACYQSQEILSFEELRIQRQPELLISVIEEKKKEPMNKRNHMNHNPTILFHQEGGGDDDSNSSCGGVVVAERQTTSFRAPVHGIGPRSEETRPKFTPSNDRSTDQQKLSPAIHVVCIPLSTSFIRRHTFTHLPSRNGFHDFSSLRSKRIQVGHAIQFMTDGSSFRIVRKIGQGGLARVYHATTVNNDNNNNNSMTSCAIKVEKPANTWEFYILNELKIRLINNNDNGIMILRSRYVIHVHALYLFKDTSYLIMEYGNQGTLLDCFNNYRHQQRRTAMTEPLAMFLTMRLLQAVQTIHDVGIIHGDLKMDNIMLAFNNDNVDDNDNVDRMDEDGDHHSNRMATTITGVNHENTHFKEKQWPNSPYLVLIDFGRAVDLTLLPSNVTLKADWPPQATDPIFVRQGISFSPRSIDYYGIASIAHWLLFGKSMTTNTMVTKTKSTEKQKIQERLKRYWHVELWQKLFDLLLNPSANNSSTSSSITTIIQMTYQILKQDNYLKTYFHQLDPHLQ